MHYLTRLQRLLQKILLGIIKYSLLFIRKIYRIFNFILRLISNVFISVAIIIFSINLYSNDLQLILEGSEILPTIMVAIGSTLVTILILTLSIAIIPIQRSIDSFSKSISSLYRDDEYNILIFVLISFFALFTFISSVDGIFFSIKPAVLFPIILSMVGITLDLLRWYHKRITKLLEPDEAIRRLTSRVIRYIKNHQVLVSNLAKTNLFLASLSKEKTSQINEERKLYNITPNHISKILYKISDLSEISIKALSKNEIATVESALNAISSITISYISCRSKNLIFYPAKEANFLVNTSDAEQLFNKVYEELFTIAARSHKISHESSSIRCLKAYAHIIEHICELTDHNHEAKDLLYIPVDYISKLILDAQSKNLDEVIYQGCIIVENISKKIYSKNNIPELDYIINDLFTQLIVGYLVSDKRAYGNNVLKIMMSRMFMQIPQHQYTIIDSLKNVLKRFENIFPLALKVNSRQSDLMYFHFSIPYQITNQKSLLYFVNTSTVFNNVSKEWINPYATFIEINDEIWHHFRRLGEQNDLGESVYLWHISSSINYIANTYFELLNNPLSEISTYTDKLIIQLSWYLSFFWCSFNHCTKIHKSYAEEAFEVVTQIGLRCYERAFIDKYISIRNEIIKCCISNLIEMLNAYSKNGKEKNQFDLAELILYLWYLRLAAKNNSEAHRVNEIDCKLIELEILKSGAVELVREAIDLRYNQFVERISENEPRFSYDNLKVVGLLRSLNSDPDFYRENSISTIFK